MADNEKDLTEPYIRTLFAKLDDELLRRGERAIVYVVGGVNIALAIDGSRTTTDIDVVVKRGFDVVFDAARAVAETEPGLGADWLNAAFTGNTPDGGLTWPWIDNKDADTPSMAFAGSALHVQLASPEMMLALKTLAQRPQDMDDIYQLMRITGITTRQGIGANLARFTGRRIFDRQGSPGMFIHVDPTFANILANAPADLRPPTRQRRRPGRRGLLRRLGRRDRAADAGTTCGIVRITSAGGVEVSRTRPCSRPDGHRGKHRFDGAG
ncbi:MAG: hypothetical protein ACR2HR_18440 [Euzebya sp.]